jgi:hypothetical protein
MGGSTRTVRIPRKGDGSSIAEEPSTEPGSASAPMVSSKHFTNSAGGTRAFRTFLLFLVGLAAIYGLFLGLAVRDTSAATGTSVEEVLTAAVAVSLVVGWLVTLGQAPAAAWIANGQLVVRERTGRSRRFPAATVRFHVLRTNGVGPFGPDPTEFVEVSAPGGGRRTYLVGAGFFDFAESPHP